MRNVAMRRKRTREPDPDEVSVANEEAEAYLKDVEGRFQKLLSPVEAYIMGIQSTLVWELPSFSGCVFIAVNIVFWLATRMRFYHLLGLTGLTVVFVDIWVHKIWPEIRVPPSKADLEEWTLVHPKLLSVPELSRHLSRLWIAVSGVIHWFIILRGTSHGKFFVLTMMVLIVFGVIGLYISGITLLYILVMSVFIIPPLFYYNMFSELYKTLEPTILRLEKIFNVKRIRSKKTKKKVNTEGQSGSGTDSDEGLEEFVPRNEESTPALAKATTVESSEESSSHTPGQFTPDMLSRGPSREMSDTDSNGDETANFAKELKALPDYDESIATDDLDLLPTDSIADIDTDTEQPDEETPKKKQTTTNDTMQFVTGHFKDSSESDADIESELATGLAFPDIQDELDGMAREDSSSNAAIAQEVMTRTMSTLMSSTMSGLSRLGETATRIGETVRSVAKSATTAMPGDDDNAKAETTGSANPASGSSEDTAEKVIRKTITESTDSDILAEFEFLEKEYIEFLEDDSAKEPPQQEATAKGHSGDKPNTG